MRTEVLRNTNPLRLLTLGVLVAVGCTGGSGIWNGQSVTESAVADLAAHLNIPTGQVIVVTSAHEVTWSNGAIGCAQPGMNYTEAEVNGYAVLLGFFDRTYSYHQGGDQPPFLCPNPTE